MLVRSYKNTPCAPGQLLEKLNHHHRETCMCVQARSRTRVRPSVTSAEKAGIWQIHLLRTGNKMYSSFKVIDPACGFVMCCHMEDNKPFVQIKNLACVLKASWETELILKIILWVMLLWITEGFNARSATAEGRKQPEVHFLYFFCEKKATSWSLLHFIWIMYNP